MTLYEGIRMSTLDLGPGHWPGTAMPGEIGNVVVGGYRTSKHRVFRHIDDLVATSEQLLLESTLDRVSGLSDAEVARMLEETDSAGE